MFPELTAFIKETMSIHPILVMEPGKPIKPFDPDEQSDPAHRVSHIQIHLSKLAPLEARSLSKRIAEVLDQVHQAVHDWPAMTALVNQAMRELEEYNASRKNIPIPARARRRRSNAARAGASAFSPIPTSACCVKARTPC